jgi:Opioid growth factor receptor (OGFr) conserved region
VAFYEGTGTDGRGRSLDDVLHFDDASLEHVHDFIQWLFPLRERSGANPNAPRLDDGAIAAFQTRPELRANLRRAYERMMAFYKAGDGWLTPGNHNHLRLTRMMISLRTLGLKDEALELHDYVTGLALRRGGVTRDTLGYWNDAIA